MGCWPVWERAGGWDGGRGGVRECCAVLTVSGGLGRGRAGAGRFGGGTGASRPSSAAPKVCVERATLALSTADLPQLGKARREAFSSPSLLPVAAAGRSSVPVGRALRGAAGRALGAGSWDERLARSPPIITDEAEAERPF